MTQLSGKWHLGESEAESEEASVRNIFAHITL